MAMDHSIGRVRANCTGAASSNARGYSKCCTSAYLFRPDPPLQIPLIHLQHALLRRDVPPSAVIEPAS